jgi:hypothetical protein
MTTIGLDAGLVSAEQRAGTPPTGNIGWPLCVCGRVILVAAAQTKVWNRQQ